MTQITQTEAGVQAARKAARQNKKILAQGSEIDIGALLDPPSTIAWLRLRNVLVYFGMIVLLSWGLSSIFRNDPDAPGFGLLTLILTGGGLVVLVLSPWIRDKLGLRPGYGAEYILQQFATNNGWRYTIDKTQVEPNDFHPAIEGVGKHQTISQMYYGEWVGYRLSSYLYTAQLPAQSNNGLFRARVYRVELHKDVVLPHIFLAQAKLNTQAPVLNFPRFFKDSQRLSLESTFEQYFATYSHTGTKTDALSILAPNVLQTLLDTNKIFDIEIVGNNIYLYARDDSATPDDVAAAFSVLFALIKHMNHRLSTWRLSLPNSKYPYMESSAGYGTIKVGDQRFDAKYLIWLGAWLFIMVRIYAGSFESNLKASLAIGVTAIAIGAFTLTNRRIKRQDGNASKNEKPWS